MARASLIAVVIAATSVAAHGGQGTAVWPPAFQPVFAGVGPVEQTEQVHEGGLSGAGRAHDRDEFTARNGDTHALKSAHDVLAEAIGF